MLGLGWTPPYVSVWSGDDSPSCIFYWPGIRPEPSRGAVCYWQLLNPPRTRSSDAHLCSMVMHRMINAAVSVRADGREAGAGERAGGSHSFAFNSKNDTIQMMGPRRGRGRTALSIPITHPVQRSINSYTTATNDKWRSCLIYFIRSHHLPAISCPPWTPLIYFEWTKFLTPILSHTAFLPPPLRPRPPPPSRGRRRPSSRCTRSRMGSRYVPRFEKPGEAPASKDGHG